METSLSSVNVRREPGRNDQCPSIFETAGKCTHEFRWSPADFQGQIFAFEKQIAVRAPEIQRLHGQIKLETAIFPVIEQFGSAGGVRLRPMSVAAIRRAGARVRRNRRGCGCPGR